ncbi:MAG: chorismate synthase [Elusimicrobia bacterium]|nr:chorismate synthase [Elusimicrobiota bacterium]
MRLLTAGESHGPALTGILEGLPAGLALESRHFAAQLARRRLGYGRGNRMKIEDDALDIVGGVRAGRTTGGPLALVLPNKDHKNWLGIMDAAPRTGPARRAVRVPRPGHADLVGALKYGHDDMRDVLERASARETAMRVALATAARRLLEELGVTVGSRVVSVGGEADETPAAGLSGAALSRRSDASPLRCLGKAAERRMAAAVDAAKAAGDTLGGVFEVVATGLPAGLGSYVQWDRRLEGELAAALMSLNAVKGVEVGLGFASAALRGSQAHDAFYWNARRTKVVRKTNRSGGIDGGITTGEPLVVRAAMKPIATLMKPLPSVDLAARKPAAAHIERSDACAVPAGAVIGESLVCLALADAFLVKFGGDSVKELKEHHAASRAR